MSVKKLLLAAGVDTVGQDISDIISSLRMLSPADLNRLDVALDAELKRRGIAD